MAGSFPFYKEQIREYLTDRFPEKAKVLDVGAGSGTYINLLGYYFKNIEAVEIYEPNIENYKLRDRYKEVYNINIVNFKYKYYDLIIFGDVIEHLSVEDAQNVLEYAYDRCKEMVVAVPYQYKQEEIDGNKYEIHIQDDLTPENVLERYPYLELLYGNKEYGYYIKRRNNVQSNDKDKDS